MRAFLSFLIVSILVAASSAFGITSINTVSISKTVAATTTPEAITATKTLTYEAVIQAKCTNTQEVFIGDATNQFHQLEPCTTLHLVDSQGNRNDFDYDLAKIYVDVAVNGEGVNVLYFQNP